MNPDAPLVYLERLRMAGDLPLALDYAWLPAEIAEPLLDATFTHTALYIELDTRCGIRLTGGREDVTAVVPIATMPRCSSWVTAQPHCRSDG